MQDNLKAKPHELKTAVRNNMDAAAEGRIPAETQEAAQATVARARETHERFSAAARNGFRDMEEALAATYDGAKAVSGKMFQNFASNTEAAFDAAEAMARAGSVPEATRIYASFLQERFAAMGQQTQELLAVSANVMTAAIGAGRVAPESARARERKSTAP